MHQHHYIKLVFFDLLMNNLTVRAEHWTQVVGLWGHMMFSGMHWKCNAREFPMLFQFVPLIFTLAGLCSLLQLPVIIWQTTILQNERNHCQVRDTGLHAGQYDTIGRHFWCPSLTTDSVGPCMCRRIQLSWYCQPSVLTRLTWALYYFVTASE